MRWVRVRSNDLFGGALPHKIYRANYVPSYWQVTPVSVFDRKIKHAIIEIPSVKDLHPRKGDVINVAGPVAPVYFSTLLDNSLLPIDSRP